MGNFDDALIALIIALTAEFYQLWGRFPTPQEVREQMSRQ